MPAETQREIAAQRRADREAEWARHGYLHVSYAQEPRRVVRPKLGAISVLSDVFDLILSALNKENRRGRDDGRRAA